jgi:DNA-binding CsgD family transcriptional regulator/tetratricopeptide (TPR) repeat protein
VLVGRETEMSVITSALNDAQAGHGSSVCFTGPPGIGKTSLLDAAQAAAPEFRPLRTTGVPGEFAIGHAGLADVVTPLRPWLSEIPPPQRAALDSALGWSAAEPQHERFLVSAATLSLLSTAAQQQPVLVLIDDLQWIDPESLTVLLFVARRIGHDAVAFLMAQRDGSTTAELAGINQFRLSGLSANQSAGLLKEHRTSPAVVNRLVKESAGNPLAILEAVRQLSPEQLRGSAPLPPVLPVGERLTTAFLDDQADLSPRARRAATIAAAAMDPAAGPVVAALRAQGIDADAALTEAEEASVLIVAGGTLTFRHPLLRAAVWQRASPGERREAHAALAAVLQDRPEQCIRHRAEATIGFDDQLADDVTRLAEQERFRLGYAASSSLFERAAQLSKSPVAAADALASAVEDAAIGGDSMRARALAGQFDTINSGAAPQTSARILLGLGFLEENAGSVPDSATLLQQAADLGTGTIRLRALVELAQVNYRLGSARGVADAANALAAVADLTDPEQEMLTSYTRAAALAFNGQWERARPPGLRAMELLESEPALRDDPRYLVIALLTAGWIGEPARALTYLDRRLDAARARGAIGVLPLALDVLAAGAVQLHRHELAYAYAGEAVELGTELGYVADVGSAHSTLAIESAARGRHDDAVRAIAEAKRLSAIAGVGGAAVQVHLVEAFCALCRGDYPLVVSILEQRIAVDDGRLPRGDYPLAVAPDLVEAYLALDRRPDAVALAARHAALHHKSGNPDILANVHRLAGMIAVDDVRADESFHLAHELHGKGSDQLAAARTRLLHGSRLRRAGRRIAAREQLRIAAESFRAMGFDAWTARADGELAATGATARRRPGLGDSLTSQETRIALLVARGQTNRDIAAALFVSPRTVEHHVASVLRKRGLRSRTELAVSLAETGTATS